MFKSKLRAYAWFMLINAFLCVAVSTRYFAFLPEFPSETIAQVFLMSGMLSQMALLSFLIGLLFCPLLFLPKHFRQLTLAIIASCGLGVLVIDTMVFAQYRFHLNVAVLDMIFSGQIVSFPIAMWLSVIVAGLLMFIFQLILVKHLDASPNYTQHGWGRGLAVTMFAALLITNGIHVWASANAFQPVTMIKRYLPLFYPATANSFMRKRGWIDEEAVARQKEMSLERGSDLNYPLEVIQTESVEKPINILMIVVDSWRTDTFNSENTPNMWKFAQNGKILDEHLSSGNATRMGIFGLFYGLPGTYWHSFLVNMQSPVLMDRLKALNYNLGIFAAAQLRSPEFDKTVFSGIENLRVKSDGDSVPERDLDITEDWLTWYEEKDPMQPNFSFLFYDSPHAYDFPKDYEHRYEPMLDVVNYLKFDNDTDPEPFFNRYKTSVHYVDSLVKRVLDKVIEKGELENTVVIITGDHGQEMNDNKLNFWGHNSNFTRPQLQVPFVLVGPEVNAKESLNVDRVTSHYDVAPTLLKNYLGVTSEIESYAVGLDLFATPVARDWLLASKYSGYAVLTDETILEVGATGQYEFMDQTNRELKNQSPNFEHLQQALEQISRFRK
ncbi:MAG: membrane-anchored protein YejM (alkaline phosphatase superfamily) [Oleiphilaceae bacterium]|jgi:membrane-anchored protein YejM (alkaline phosphatase superfamily)